MKRLSGFVVLTIAFILSALSPWAREYQEYRASIPVLSAVVPPSEFGENDETVQIAAVSGSGETLMIGPDPKVKERFLGLVADAQTSVDFSVYLLSDPDAIDAFVSARWRGVKVRAILERDVLGIPNANRKVKERLLLAGAEVVSAKDDPFAYIHAKYLVADGTDYVFSTANYAKTSLTKNREFFIFGNDPVMANFLSLVFSADFSGLPFSGPVPPGAYLAPLDARKKLLPFLSGAQRSIRIFAASLSDPEIVQLLSERARSGVDVAVCLGTDSEDLQNAGFSGSVRKTVSRGPYLHAKTALVDRSVLWVGSANFTKNSLDRNREVGSVRMSSGEIRAYENTLTADCKWEEFGWLR